jgi:hypothetical protein
MEKSLEKLSLEETKGKEEVKVQMSHSVPDQQLSPRSKKRETSKF